MFLVNMQIASFFFLLQEDCLDIAICCDESMIEFLVSYCLDMLASPIGSLFLHVIFFILARTCNLIGLIKSNSRGLEVTLMRRKGY